MSPAEIPDVTILRIAECPSWVPAQQNILQALGELNLDAQLSIQVITSTSEANDKRFGGSPSFLVNGTDLFPKDNVADEHACRIYIENGRARGYPSVESLKTMLKKVLNLEQNQ